MIAYLQHKPVEIIKAGVKHEYTSKAENQNCLKCHGVHKYECTNPDDSTQQAFKKMYAENVIDTTAYYHSNHYDFKCSDCHSADYKKTPHNPALKFEEISACIDCHGEDTTYAKFHFDSINVDYGKSIHATKLGKDFSCWSCHNSHTYKTQYKDSSKTVEQAIEYANAMCLSCHTSNDRMQYFGDEKTDITKKHQWLTNQDAHFKKVRCIDCHTEPNSNSDVAHNLVPKEKAIRKCITCHAPNSKTLNNLYLTRKSIQAEKLGFTHPELVKDANVIGANQNNYLSIIALSIIGLMIVGLTVHIIFRIKLSKKNGKS